MRRNKLLRIELLMAIIGSGSSLSICLGNFSTLLTIFFIITVIIQLLFKSTKIQINFHERSTKSIIILVLCMLLPSLFRITSLFNYAGKRIILTIGIAIMIILMEDRERLLQEFIWLMRMMALISLFCYLAFNLLNLPYNWMIRISTLSEAGITRYYSIIFYNIMTWALERNCGPFWEPSIFAGYLSMALVIRIFLMQSDENQKIDVLIFVITIVTTLSAGGFLLAILILLMYLWRNNSKSFWVKGATIVGIVLVVIMYDYISNILLRINPLVFNKIFNLSSNGSSSTRLYSAWININIWMRSPIIGNGLANTDTLYNTLRISLAPKGLSPAQTSTNTIYLAAFGIFGIYYTLVCIKASKQSVLNTFQSFLFFLIILIIVNETPQTNMVLTYCLLFTLVKPSAEILQTKGSIAQ